MKRETSQSVSDLHDVSDSIKRMAISQNGMPQPALNLKNPAETSHLHSPILTVMSTAKDGFSNRYEILGEIGKGGFSTVYACRDKQTQKDYAVKVLLQL